MVLIGPEDVAGANQGGVVMVRQGLSQRTSRT
jgi:hypothetical protein